MHAAPGLPELIEAFLLSKLAARQYEVFALLLNRRNRLIEYVEVARGTLDVATSTRVKS